MGRISGPVAHRVASAFALDRASSDEVTGETH